MSANTPPENPDQLRPEVIKLMEDIAKVKLENQKLLRDLECYDERLEMERKRTKAEGSRFMWETIRLLGIAVITGVITLVTNWYLKKFDIKETRNTAEWQRFLGNRDKVLNMENMTLEKSQEACDVLEEFKDFEFPGIQAKRTELITLCGLKATFNGLQEKSTKLAEQVKATRAPRVDTQKTIDSLENRKQNLVTAMQNGKQGSAAEVKSIDSSVKELVDKAGIKNISSESEAISQSYIKNTKIVKDISAEAIQSQSGKHIAEGYPRTSWFKKGFFLVFDNMKITLVDFGDNKESITAEVCESTGTEICTRDKLVIPATVLDKTSSIRFSRNNAEYIIRLDRVGKAGNNPFTKAAYITFEKYAP